VLLVLGLSAWSVVALLVAVQLQWLIFSALYHLGLLADLSTNVLTVAQGIVLYAIMFTVLVGAPWLAMRRGPGLKLLGIDRFPEWRDIGVALSGIVGYFLIAGIVMWLFAEYVPQIDVNQAQDTGVSMPLGMDRLWVFLLFVAIGPIMEELIFRGYLYGVLRRRGISFVVATIIVSVLFGLAHGQWNVGINVGILSIMMCIGREATDSIWPGILMHMMKNGIAYYLLFVSPIVPGIQ